MNVRLCGLMAVSLIVLSAGSADAQQRQNKNRPSYGYTAPPGADQRQRQLRNERAYERGEYYEHDSNALPFGSRAWWEQKERERADEH
ncbi:MAG TPA: hypothetical protein VKF35_24395 [Hyphomicrobiaceae bacterium]|nr:hypothetical protein [Hyphomicrobiaceae bacterium]